MWDISTRAAFALLESHTIDVRVTVYSPGFGVVPALPVAGGSVEVDATSQTRRTATLLVDPTYWPTAPTDILTPYGAEASIEYGIVFADDTTEWVPLGVFGLDTVSRTRPYSDSGAVEVKLVDRAARVAEDQFDAPTQTVAGATHVTEIRRLIQETLGAAVAVVDRTGSTQVAAQIEMDKDRWADGVELLATAIGAECFFDVLGQGVIRPQPTLDDPPVWIVDTGDGGALLSAADSLSREGVYNRWVVSGAGGVSATVTDLDPASPTYWGGAFGKKSRRYSSGLLTTAEQCTLAGTALLARNRGAGVKIEMSGLVNPALDAGDVILARTVDGNLTPHILDTVSIPLTPDGTQTLGARSTTLPPEN